MKRIIYALMVVVVLALSARSASAEPRSKLFDLSVGGSFGGAVVEWVDPSAGSTTRTLSLNAVARGRIPGHTPLGLELALNVPHGASATVLVDLARVDRVSAHVAVGAFFPIANRQLSVTKIERSWDLTLGYGVEVRVYKKWEIMADWRVHLPDPTTILRIYGDFARPLYDEALRGGQLWLGMQHAF